MESPGKSRGVVHFAPFELDLEAGALKKHGVKLRLPEQSFQILALLLERPGQVVTRDALRQKLWTADTFVDFDVGLNNAILRLRHALGDSAETPRYVETLPRRGYRFIAPVDQGAPAAVHASAAASPPLVAAVEKPSVELAAPSKAQLRLRGLWFAGLALAALIVMLVGFNITGLRQRLLGRSHPPRIQSIAVLPLENLTGDLSQEYFVDGMTDALITELAQIGALRVISRTSAMQYKGTKKPLSQIARELNVDAVVEGAVVRSGNQVKITAQLIHAPSDRHLWAKSYERDLSNIIVLQKNVGLAIAAEIQVKLTPQEQALLAKPRPVNPEAYEAYLKGRYFWNERTEPALYKAIDYFNAALRIDSNYAPAYVGLADSYGVLGFGMLAALWPKEAAAKARAAAMKALELDETLGEAHAALGWIKFNYEWDWTGAEQEFRRAIELSPGYATGYHWYAIFLRNMGRKHEAFANIKRAQQLDPLSPNVGSIAAGVSSLGRRDEVIAQFQKVLELDPNHFNTHVGLARTYQQWKMYDMAITEYQKAVEISKGDASVRSGLAHVYAVSGHRAEAEKILQELKVQDRRRNLSYQIARIYTGLEQKDEAFDWLERSYARRSSGMCNLLTDPMLDPLRADPRFQDLVRRMHFPEVATGK